MANIVLPYNWKPRPYQKDVWDYLANGGKRAVMCWHRRSGKDELGLHHMACASQERVATYWYCLPKYAQARKAIWEAINPHTGIRRINEAFPLAMRKTTRENEMSITFLNGSTFQVVGSDDPDSLVGSPPAGIIFSEYALSNPSAWAYLMPIFEENDGWAIFNSTPRGKNHFKKISDMASKSKDWFFDKKTADETKIFSKEQLQRILEELQDEHGEDFGHSIWLQEYFVSFEAAILGSIYGEFLAKVERSGRFLEFEVDKDIPVNTAWDLGMSDATAIWFYQVVGDEIRIIDYYESNFKEVPEYAQVVKNKAKEGGYKYATHWLPHDAKAKRLGMGGKSIMQQLQDEKIGRTVIVGVQKLQDQIAAGRKTLSKCWFLKGNEQVEKGLEYLKSYRYEYDEKKKIFRTTPEHDYTSHCASAFMTMAMSWRNPKTQEATQSFEQKLMTGALAEMTFGKIKQQHLSRMKSKRSDIYH